MRRRVAVIFACVIGVSFTLPGGALAQERTLELLSVPEAGAGGSAAPSTFFGPPSRISEDGSRVFFESEERLVTADTDSIADLYERVNGVTRLVSAPAPGGSAGASSTTVFADASRDGSRIFFETDDPLVAGDTDGVTDVYERSGGTTKLLSAPGPGGGPDDVHVGFYGANQAGDLVVMATGASLTADDPDGAPPAPDIGLVDLYARSGGTTSIVSGSSLGAAAAPGQVSTGYGSQSVGGQTVFFESTSKLLASDTDTDGSSDVYAYSNGAVRLASAPGAGGGSAAGSIGLRGASRDGSTVFFESGLPLLAADTNASTDVYKDTNETLSLVSQGDSGTGVFESLFRGSNPSGTHAFFDTRSALTDADTDDAYDLYQRAAGTTELVTAPEPGGSGAADEIVAFQAVSDDGSRVFFSSTNSFVPEDSDGLFDVHERSGGVTKLVSIPAPGGGGGGTVGSIGSAFSLDGSRVVFMSDDALVTADTDSTFDVYERFGGTTTLLSGPRAGASGPPSAVTGHIGISADGSRVVFATEENLIGADTDGLSDVYSAVLSEQCEAPAGERGRAARRSAGPAPEVGTFRRSLASGDPRPRAKRGSGGAPKLTELVPDQAVSGAAVLVNGQNLGGRGLRATVGGRKAKITQARERSLLVEVPKLKPGSHRLVVRLGKKSASRGLRVVKPFDGTPGTLLDSAHATSAAIGPAGGELATRGADGTSYALSIPAGALLADTEISLTPVKRFKGLPFTGDDVAGAELGPDGLSLNVPATLRITGGGDFDGSTIGFGEGAEGLETSEPTGLGKTLVLQIEHFSFKGASEAELADAANTLQPYIAHRGNLSKGQIREVLRLLAIFDERFSPPSTQGLKPPSWCQSQPVCKKATTKGESSLESHLEDSCKRGTANPTIFAFQELLTLQSQLDRMGGNEKFSILCRDQIARDLTVKVLAALDANPLDPFRDFEFPGGVGGRADVDGDGDISAWEMAEALATEFQLVGEVSPDGEVIDLTIILQIARDQGLDRILFDNAQLCSSDSATGVRNLRRGLAYARRTNERAGDFLAALASCGIELVVVPASVELGTGGKRVFEALPTNQASDEIGSVRWSATGGAIRESEEGGRFLAEYTAPDSPGIFTVRARSTLNADRSSTAQVTVVQDGC